MQCAASQNRVKPHRVLPRQIVLTQREKSDQGLNKTNKADPDLNSYNEKSHQGLIKTTHVDPDQTAPEGAV